MGSSRRLTIVILSFLFPLFCIANNQKDIGVFILEKVYSNNILESVEPREQIRIYVADKKLFLSIEVDDYEILGEFEDVQSKYLIIDTKSKILTISLNSF